MEYPQEKKDDSLLPIQTPASGLPTPQTSKPRTRLYRLLHGLFVFSVIYNSLNGARIIARHFDLSIWPQTKHESLCPQVDVLTPEKNGQLWSDLSEKVGTDDFKSKAVNWLGGAVRVPTESFDDMGAIGTDPRWEAFGPFHDYLLGAFPLVHTSLKMTKVNTYGLFYEWIGSDASLKPILLAAHQDVVPVAPTTVDKWTHPPFSGYFDGERIWGRGSSDDKSGLIGILSAIESLLGSGFKPTRTVVLAFGFDEETSGKQGASALSHALLEAYGENGFAFVIDEGAGFQEQYGGVFATPGIAEKGYLDVRVQVTAPGGHSSIPPSHTSIGILSALLVHYETHPYDVYLRREDPLYTTFQCIAEHAKDLPSRVRKVIKRSAHSKKALDDLQSFVSGNLVYKSLAGTTQAIDLIEGGVKSNALPEQAWALVNHRISVLSSVDATKEHDTKLLAKLASKFNLTYNAFGTRISEEDAPSSGTLTLIDAFGYALEPAPVTPTKKGAAPYELLSGTIKATFNSHRNLVGADNIHIAPGIMSGNTDTRYYWKLTPHIFRYGHHNGGNGTDVLSGVHTVNESIVVDSFLEMIRFFVTLILNSDESTAL